MSSDFKRLREAGVKPLSVKTDAFTFREEDEEKVRGILNVKAIHKRRDQDKRRI